MATVGGREARAQKESADARVVSGLLQGGGHEECESLTKDLSLWPELHPTHQPTARYIYMYMYALYTHSTQQHYSSSIISKSSQYTYNDLAHALYYNLTLSLCVIHCRNQVHTSEDPRRGADPRVWAVPEDQEGGGGGGLSGGGAEGRGQEGRGPTETEEDDPPRRDIWRGTSKTNCVCEISNILEFFPQVVDVMQSIFPSATFRERVANGSRVQLEQEWEEDEEFKVRRSATSPPLLESFSGHYTPLSERVSSSVGGRGERHEVQVEAEVHQTTSLESTKSQLLSIEPTSGAEMEGTGGEAEMELEIARTKSFSLKFSEDDL